MSFQFFSKLDGDLTDGPVSQTDPNRGLRDMIQGGGQAAGAVRKRIQEDKRQSRIDRRIYRQVMRRGDAGQMMQLGKYLEERKAAGGPGVSRDSNRDFQFAREELVSRGGGANIQGRKDVLGGGLDRKTSLESFSNDLGRSKLLNDSSTSQADFEAARGKAYERADSLGLDRSSVDKSIGRGKETTQSGSTTQKTVPAGSDAEGATGTGKPDQKIAPLEVGSPEWWERNKQLGGSSKEEADADLAPKVPETEGGLIEKAQQRLAVEKETGRKEGLRSEAEQGMIDSENRVTEETRQAGNLADAEKGILESENRSRLDGLRNDAASGLLESKNAVDVRVGLEQADIDAKAHLAKLKEGDVARDLDNANRKANIEKLEVSGQAKVDGVRNKWDKAIASRAQGRKQLGEAQTAQTDAYFAAAELSSPANGHVGATNDTIQGRHTPFAPHGLFSGDLKNQADRDPAKFKQSIDNGTAFNAALGGKEVTLRYNDKGERTLPDGTKVPNKIQSAIGDKAVSFQADAFTSLKNKVLEGSSAKNKDHLGHRVNSKNYMDKIVKSAVDNNYPIELDGELMAVPEFREKLSTARLKKGLKTDAKGFTIFE